MSLSKNFTLSTFLLILHFSVKIIPTKFGHFVYNGICNLHFDYKKSNYMTGSENRFIDLKQEKLSLYEVLTRVKISYLKAR